MIQNKEVVLEEIEYVNREQLTCTIELMDGHNFIANGILVKSEKAKKLNNDVRQQLVL